MRTITTSGLVAIGYIAALVAAVAAVLIRRPWIPAEDLQASSGMHAFGDLLLFLGVFALTASVPTLAAVALLRNRPRVWMAGAAGWLVFAMSGLVAVPALWISPGGARSGPLPVLAGLYGVLHLLASPLLALLSALCAWLAPTRGARRFCVAAASVEATLVVIAVLHFGGAFLR